MGNKPCCCKDDKDPSINVKVHDVVCCQAITSTCCIRASKKHHHHHKHHEKTTLSITELKLDSL